MNEYGWYPFTMMGALGGIALVLGLLQLLEYHERTAAAKPVSSLLRYIGKNSFIFYSLNQVGLLIGEEILGACGIPLNNITWPWQLLWGGRGLYSDCCIAMRSDGRIHQPVLPPNPGEAASY